MTSWYRRLLAAATGATALALMGTAIAAHAQQENTDPSRLALDYAASQAALPGTIAGSTADNKVLASASPSSPARPVAAGAAFGLKATLYITTERDSGRDSVGCTVVPMRTVAVDGKIVRRHTILFIKETVGLPMPDGSVHDGYWYATDVGSAIHAGRVDLYTGKGYDTIAPLLHLNLKTLTVKRAGQFAGCPSRDGAVALTQAQPDSAQG